MLVLSRRDSERIHLGDSIVVTVVKIAGDRVRLGIEAPANVVVLRGELQRREHGVKGNSSILVDRKSGTVPRLRASA